LEVLATVRRNYLLVEEVHGSTTRHIAGERRTPIALRPTGLAVRLVETP